MIPIFLFHVYGLETDFDFKGGAMQCQNPSDGIGFGQELEICPLSFFFSSFRSKYINIASI